MLPNRRFSEVREAHAPAPAAQRNSHSRTAGNPPNRRGSGARRVAPGASASAHLDGLVSGGGGGGIAGGVRRCGGVITARGGGVVGGRGRLRRAALALVRMPPCAAALKGGDWAIRHASKGGEEERMEDGSRCAPDRHGSDLKAEEVVHE
jgi:hypothetical protein